MRHCTDRIRADSAAPSGHRTQADVNESEPSTSVIGRFYASNVEIMCGFSTHELGQAVELHGRAHCDRAL